MIKTLYHGSNHIIEKPQYGLGRLKNDYGQGFYCTEHIELAKEWACPERIDGIVNKYELDMKGLAVLNLSSDGYHILNWLAILLENRIFDLSFAPERRAREYILENFLPEYKKYDVIVGYRADDSYFLFARAFISNNITLSQLKKAMRLGNLGEQYCIKSEKAFEHLSFKSSIIVEHEKYYFLRKKRDEKARADYIKDAEEEDIDGVFLRDIIREGWKNDDPRL